MFIRLTLAGNNSLQNPLWPMDFAPSKVDSSLIELPNIPYDQNEIDAVVHALCSPENVNAVSETEIAIITNEFISHFFNIRPEICLHNPHEYFIYLNNIFRTVINIGEENSLNIETRYGIQIMKSFLQQIPLKYNSGNDPRRPEIGAKGIFEIVYNTMMIDLRREFVSLNNGDPDLISPQDNKSLDLKIIDSFIAMKNPSSLSMIEYISSVIKTVEEYNNKILKNFRIAESVIVLKNFLTIIICGLKETNEKISLDNPEYEYSMKTIMVYLFKFVTEESEYLWANPAAFQYSLCRDNYLFWKAINSFEEYPLINESMIYKRFFKFNCFNFATYYLFDTYIRVQFFEDRAAKPKLIRDFIDTRMTRLEMIYKTIKTFGSNLSSDPFEGFEIQKVLSFFASNIDMKKFRKSLEETFPRDEIDYMNMFSDFTLSQEDQASLSKHMAYYKETQI